MEPSSRPARFAEVEKFVVARGAVDDMLPMRIVLQIVKSRRARCEFSQNDYSGATTPFRIRINGFHGLSVFMLQSIPLLFR